MNRRPTEDRRHIKDWPEGDRPREMLLEKGKEAKARIRINRLLQHAGWRLLEGRVWDDMPV